MPKIVVVGSINMDLVVLTSRYPEIGETLTGEGFMTFAGGKGANQAVAASRLGSSVVMLGCVGNDAFGRELSARLLNEGVDTAWVDVIEEVETGVAAITVAGGDNAIVVIPGANHRLSEAHVQAAERVIRDADVVLSQLEVPMPTVLAAARMARKHGKPFILNPAPASALPDALYSSIDLLVPNETEATLLTGITVRDPASAEEAARSLLARGVRSVLITLGANGVAVIDDAGERHLPAHVVKAVDTTAAGDTFIGGLTAGLVEGMAMDEAVALGQRASALCVTRHGAQPSIPYRREIA